MRTVRIYQPGPYAVGETVVLSPQASQHVQVVLRMKLGETLTLFCGDNREFQTVITQIDRKMVSVMIQAVAEVNRESSRAIHLAAALSKGERMELVIQKAVELGIHSITPLLTAHCVVRLDEKRLSKKQLQWQAIAIAACEQCGRNQLPIIYPLCPLPHYLQHCQTSLKLLLSPYATKSWRTGLKSIEDQPSAQVTLLIGPEGGLREDEVDMAIECGFSAITLGPRILRTETAAMAALTVIQAVMGDL